MCLNRPHVSEGSSDHRRVGDDGSVEDKLSISEGKERLQVERKVDTNTESGSNDISLVDDVKSEENARVGSVNTRSVEEEGRSDWKSSRQRKVQV